MSYEQDFDYGMYTEQEIKAGVPHFRDDSEIEREEEQVRRLKSEFIEGVLQHRIYKNNSLYIMRRIKEFTQKISDIENKDEISEIFSKEAYSLEIESVIDSFAKKESIGVTFVRLSQEADCITILIKRMLSKFAFLPITEEIVLQLKALTTVIYRNPLKVSVYDRVGSIQSFIHTKVDEEFDKGSYKLLPSAEMKNLLSTARLHLYLHEIKNLNSSILFELAVSERSQMHNEQAINTDTRVLKDKKLIKNWKVRHMTPFIDMFSGLLTQKVNDAKTLELDWDVDIFTFRKCVVNLYNDILHQQ